MKQWSANCGTRVSATWRIVTLSSSELDSRSPMRSSRPMRSLARWPPRRVTSLAMITMPEIVPSAWHRRGVRADEDPRAVEPLAGERTLPRPAAQHVVGHVLDRRRITLLDAKRQKGTANQVARVVREAEQ